MIEKTYRLPIRTEAEYAHAEKVQEKMYSIYNSVQVTQFGIDRVEIKCSYPIRV